MRSLHQGMIEQLILTKEFHNLKKLDPKSLNLFFLQYFLNVCCINKLLLLVLMLLLVLQLQTTDLSPDKTGPNKIRPKPH